MTKPFLTVTYYRLRQWTVQTTIVDCTVCHNGLYSPLAETVLHDLIKELSRTEEKA